MKKTLTFTLASALIAMAAFASASSVWAGALKVQPGLWKTTVTASSNGQTMPPHAEERCITQKEIDDFGNKLAETTNAPHESCQRTAFKETSNTVEFKYECTGQFAMNGEGDFKFDRPGHYTGKVTTKGNIMGQEINNSSAMEGTRVGDCTAKDAMAH